MFPWYLEFFDEISSLSSSIVFLYFLALITEEGFLISPSYSLELCIQMGESKIAQSCPTLCDPINYTVHGILQARILEWVAFPFSRGSSQPRDRTQVSRIAGKFIRVYLSFDPLPLASLLFSAIYLHILLI